MMNNKFIKITSLTALLGGVLSLNVFAAQDVPLEKANTDVHNRASLQNGAKLYFNYCAGCHSIEFMRYSRIAKDLGIDKELVLKNFAFNDKKIGSLIIASMSQEHGEAWFGAAPPDLSLTARSRGVDWIYSYLNNFYTDDSRPFGVNNHILIGTAMPDVLANRQASIPAKEFDNEILDIANFLDYVSEPIQLKRTGIGFNVLIFLLILLILSYFLKKEYWRDVKYGPWKAKN